ncbi:F0F1 ATP synthase subunit epsilon [Candidatus Gracilibacteria bacterium]|nr:F0F1 ATP synthase subunit epsilon [Candidatus Gracilibacteria bacterium]NUJ98849.1 F0F1 ATP synthase subunit epsilon [Candidatus Gracilibacteria bacterium]
MNVKILSFNGEAFVSNNVISLSLMTGLGEITILEKHAPLITSIRPSTMYLIIRDENGVERRDDFAIGSGVVEVKDSQVKIMSDMLIDIEDVSIHEAEHARTFALELMQRYKDSSDRMDMERFIEAEDMLLKSIAQLKLYDLKK